MYICKIGRDILLHFKKFQLSHPVVYGHLKMSQPVVDGHLKMSHPVVDCHAAVIVRRPPPPPLRFYSEFYTTDVQINYTNSYRILNQLISDCDILLYNVIPTIDFRQSALEGEVKDNTENTSFLGTRTNAIETRMSAAEGRISTLEKP